MTDPNKTLIAVLLDRSGSMMTVKSATEKGFDDFIADQRDKDGVATVTLAQFDDAYELVYSDVPVADVPALQLIPRGSTALYDAVGKLTTDVGATLAATPEDQRPGTVLVVIMTDGHENASKEWTHEAVQKLITEQQDRWQWTYLFLGASIDAVDVGAAMGIARANSLRYSPANTAETFGVVSRAATNTRSGKSFSGFSSSDREEAVGGNTP